MKPDIHCVGTHWIRGFITFQLGRRGMNAAPTPYDLVRTVLESRKPVLRRRPRPDQEA